MFRPLLALAALAFAAAPAMAAVRPGQKHVLMIAGKPSHPPGAHEHNAGIQLLAKCLAQHSGALVETHVQLNGEWPTAEELGRADAIVIYSDGGKGHPAVQADHLAQLGKEMQRGAGLVCLHYAVEVPNDQGGQEFLQWLGGYFETDWSVNPHWTANFKSLPKHPISSGVQPFSTLDEWYFHMRFRKDMQGVQPILSAVPPAETMARPDGAHSGNPAVRAEVAEGRPQHVAWASEREGGGRGFGFTGGHFHQGWANENQRRLVLNGILWAAHADVPASGVQSEVTEADLAANLDPKPVRKPKAPEAPKPAPTK